jgi:hypothetical protein
LIPVLALALLPLAQDPAPPPSLELRVERGIARALGWLKSRQAREGSWPGPEEAHPGGVTALCCYALVRSGVEASDPALLGGLRSIAAVRFKSTYSASVHLLLASALRAEHDRAKTRPAMIPDDAARASFDFLVANQREGLWAYPDGAVDMSNTQFALLGLRAGTELGFEVPWKMLERCAGAIFRLQSESGGFSYAVGDAPRGGMTAATLAGIHVLGELARARGSGAFPRGNDDVASLLAKKKDRVRAAEAWMEARFDAARPAFGERGWTSSWDYSFLWAVERWCSLTGRRLIGTHDWYREGAERLLALQSGDGDFGGSIEDTCFALLFLRRATLTGWEDRSETYRRIDAEKRAATPPRIFPAEDVPRIADWLLAGPYRDETGSPRFEKADLARLRPREKTKYENEVFERVELGTKDWTNLEVATGREGDHVFWILSTNLVWEPAGEKRQPLEATLWFAFEDPWKIWLDGKLVSSEMRTASPIREDVVLPVTLEPGVHALVVLSADEVGSSAFSGRITDRAGRALQSGFSIAAEPPWKR